MRQAFYLSFARRRAFWTHIAASGLVVALANPGAALAAPAATQAAPAATHAAAAAATACSRGQFRWKSKNKCIDKAEAARLGIYHGPIPPQDKPTAGADGAAKGQPAPGQPPAETAPAPEAPSASQQPAALAPPAMQSVATPAPATPSPYGDLPTDGFNKAK